MTTEEQRKRQSELGKQKRAAENYYITTNCRFCPNSVEIKKTQEKNCLKRGGGTCKECRRKISTQNWIDYRSGKTKEELSAQGKYARSCAKPENLSEGVRKQWATFRSDPDKYKSICEARVGRMKTVWENYSDEQKNFIVKSLVDSADCGRSKVSEELKKSLIDNGLYEGFESEQVFHGFVPDEINHEKKVIIEVFGDLYHCNPKKYKNPDVFISATKRTVGEQWARDKIKLDAYQEYGYTTIVVWESDIRKRLGEQLTRIKEILKEKEEAYGLPPHN